MCRSNKGITRRDGAVVVLGEKGLKAPQGRVGMKKATLVRV